MSQGSWVAEFGPEYQVPPEIEALVQQGRANDMSWHNDMCPSFGVIKKAPANPQEEAEEAEYEIRLWVEHPNPALREMPTGARFTVSYHDFFGDEIEVVSETDSAAEAAAAYVQTVGAHAQATTPLADPETRIYDLHTKKKRFGLTPEEDAEFGRLLQERGKPPAYMASWVARMCKFARDFREEAHKQIADLEAKGLVEEDVDELRWLVAGVPGPWYLWPDEDPMDGSIEWSAILDNGDDKSGGIYETTYDPNELYNWVMRNHAGQAPMPNAQAPKTTPDAETLIYDLHTKKKRFGLTPQEEAELGRLLKQRGTMPAYMASLWLCQHCKFSSK